MALFFLIADNLGYSGIFLIQNNACYFSVIRFISSIYYHFAAVDWMLVFFLYNVVCSYTIGIFESISNRLWKRHNGADRLVHYMVGNLLGLFTRVWLKTYRTTRPFPEIAESS